MFDAQKLLGMVLRQAIGGSLGGSRRRARRSSRPGLPRGLEGQIGMGLLGLAVAAFEHFRQPASGPDTVGAASAGADALVHPGAARRDAVPPPPPPPPPPDSAPADQLRSLHLLRAMIAAAHADGAIDAKERQDMVARGREAGLGEEDLAALDKEIGSPLSVEQLVLQTPEELRQQAYVAALIAIDVDTAAEHSFLATLADGLRIDADDQARLKQQLGLG
jgi:uncharacterized membrane protein YebE (DUF533 family)